MANCFIFSIYHFQLRKKMMLTKLLLDKEMNHAGNRRQECFKNHDIAK